MCFGRSTNFSTALRTRRTSPSNISSVRCTRTSSRKTRWTSHRVGHNSRTYTNLLGLVLADVASMCSVRYYHFDREIGSTFHSQTRAICCCATDPRLENKELFVLPPLESIDGLSLDMVHQIEKCRYQTPLS